MKDVVDSATGELPELETKGRRGRPKARKAAKTGAERQAAYRARKAAELDAIMRERDQLKKGK